MNKTSILVPYDFSEASQRALIYAAALAAQSGLGLHLFHLAEADEDQRILINRMRADADALLALYPLNLEFSVDTGTVFDAIPKKAQDERISLCVMCTHGIRGLRQMLLGADILKVVKNMPVPVIVVQEKAAIPARGIKKILLPAGGHEDFDKLSESLAQLAKQSAAEISIYSIEKPGLAYTETMNHNLSEAKTIFERQRVPFKRIKEDAAFVSVGFARQTLQYAHENGMELIAVMSNSTAENAYFAQADKEQLLTNEYNIPVLCAGMVDKLN